ncbi:MAG: hypothetical protein IPP66_21715 [Anaerolineales bacterium]|nr:hypothetical protein [Anaerolineales bacterium]
MNKLVIWWNIFLDGFSILNDYKVGVFIFFVCIFGLGLITIKLMSNGQLNSELNSLVGVGVGCITLSLLSYIVAMVSLLLPSLLRPLSIFILIGTVLFLFKNLNRIREIKINADFFALSVGFIFMLCVRLAYLTRIILPPYSDSPIHYQIVVGIIYPDTANLVKISLNNVLNNYYHHGFHSLTAWLVLTSGLDLSTAIPLLGQLFLVIAPISVAALVYGLTKSKSGAAFSGLLSAVGWLMPSFSVNWGKFPALAAISTMPVIVLLLWLALRNDLKKDKFLVYVSVLVIGITLIHTRIIICLAIAFIGFSLSRKLQLNNELSFFQTVRFSLLFVLVLWPLLQPLARFYNSPLVWAILLIITPFAFRSHPTASVGISLFLFGLCLVALIPNLTIGNKYALLDRQFLEMALFVPLSTMGGLGFSGLIRNLEVNRILQQSMTIAIIGCVVFNFLLHNSIYPDVCCNYFGKKDELAFQWIRENLSNNTLFLIPTFKNNGQVYGTDAGVWLSPLLQMPTNKLSFNTNWDSIDTLNKICATGAKEIYIYSGGKNNSFNDSRLSQTSWTSPVFRDGEVAIYKVSECTNILNQEDLP